MPKAETLTDSVRIQQDRESRKELKKKLNELILNVEDMIQIKELRTESKFRELLNELERIEGTEGLLSGTSVNGFINVQDANDPAPTIPLIAGDTVGGIGQLPGIPGI